MKNPNYLNALEYLINAPYFKISAFRYFTILSFLFISSYSFAQYEINYSTQDGLICNTVYDIIEDNENYIWFATDHGLSRYNGFSFKNYNAVDGLPDSPILGLYEDNLGRIWYNGYNGKTGYFYQGKIYNEINTKLIDKLSFKTFIHDFEEDRYGNIWFLSKNTIKKLTNKGEVLTYTYPNLPESGSKFKIFHKSDDEIQILASSVNGLFKIDINGDKWKKVKPDELSQKNIESISKKYAKFLIDYNDEITSISKSIEILFESDHKNTLFKNYKFLDHLWITNTKEGLLVINSKNKSDYKHLLKDEITTRGFIDSYNNIWIGTLAGGVYKYNSNSFNTIELPNSFKREIFTSSQLNNHLFISNATGEVAIIDLEKNKIRTVKSISDSKIHHMKSYNNFVYACDDYSIYKIDTVGSFERIVSYENYDITTIKSFDIDQNKIITIHSGSELIHNIENKKTERVEIKDVLTVSIVNKDSIFFGTTHGIHLLSDNTTKPVSIIEGIDNNVIKEIIRNDGTIIFSIFGKGLIVYHKGNVKIFNEDNGLLSNIVEDISVNEKKILANTNKGLSIINANNEIINLKREKTDNYEKYLQASFNNYVYKIQNGIIIFYNLNQSKSKNNKSITAYIESTKVNGEKHSLENKLNHFENNIEFLFSAITINESNDVVYKYRLAGVDNQWKTSKKKYIVYNNLPSGVYRFELLAYERNSGIESKALNIDFTIAKPFYKKVWFVYTISIFSFLILLLFYLNKRRNYNKMIEMNNQMLLFKYKALNNQMNPHFIKNLLTSIVYLAKENKSVIESLNQFSELVYLSLKFTKNNLIKLKEEIEAIQLYVNLQKLRFKDSFDFSITLSPKLSTNLNELVIPPFLIQPLIENAIIACAGNQNKKGKITVSFRFFTDDYYFCIIEDNGENKTVKDDGFKRTQISFKNISSRISIINDLNDEYIKIYKDFDKIKSNNSTRVILKIPTIYK